MNSIAAARLKYRPDDITLLFIAESPPESIENFFYFENVDKHDALFLEMMKVLYRPQLSTPMLRQEKGRYLSRFRDDGFYLMDSMVEPIGVKSTKVKTTRIIDSRGQLLLTLMDTIHKPTPIVLISRPVYDALCQYLISNGYNVLNREMIDFPGSGGQRKFRDKLKELLRFYGLMKIH